MKPKNTICLWFDKDAHDAARFYAATFPDSEVTAVQKAPGGQPRLAQVGLRGEEEKEEEGFRVPGAHAPQVAYHARPPHQELAHLLRPQAPGVGRPGLPPQGGVLRDGGLEVQGALPHPLHQEAVRGADGRRQAPLHLVQQVLEKLGSDPHP